MPRLSLQIDHTAHDALIHLAVTERRSIPLQAEVLLMKAIHQANKRQQRQRAERMSNDKAEAVHA